jgi:uncharacterized protein YndB with AHSA1/START domain
LKIGICVLLLYKLKLQKIKIFKIILFSILGLIVLLLLVAAFVNKDLNVTKEIIINKSRQDVFAYVKLLKNQDSYSKWAGLDPTMKKTYTGTDGTVGFISAWESNNKEAGSGEQEILKIDEGNRIDYSLRFIKPFKSNANAFTIFDDAGINQTKVKWGFTSQMAYPMNLMKVFVNMEEMVGKDFEVGLENLKKVMEK